MIGRHRHRERCEVATDRRRVLTAARRFWASGRSEHPHFGKVAIDPAIKRIVVIFVAVTTKLRNNRTVTVPVVAYTWPRATRQHEKDERAETTPHDSVVLSRRRTSRALPNGSSPS